MRGAFPGGDAHARPAGTARLDRFVALKDPRRQAKVLDPLPEILRLLLCATLAGADDLVEIELWGNQHLKFLRRFLPFTNGTPSHDPLGAVLGVLDPELVKRCCAAWVEGLRAAAPDCVAIDGQTSRRTQARGQGREPLHLVSTWATRQRLVLGPEAVSGKANEITAISAPVGTAGAAGRPGDDRRHRCPGNDRGHHPRPRRRRSPGAESQPAGHGQGDRSLLRRPTAGPAPRARDHRGRPRGIEIRLHGVLGVVFRDDRARRRTGRGPENMAVVRHMTINLLRQAKPTTSLKNRRKLAGWNLDDLDRLIRGTA